jgi:hypothetical protein
MLNPKIRTAIHRLTGTKGAYVNADGKISCSSFFVIYQREEELYVCPASVVMPFALSPIEVRGEAIQLSRDTIEGVVPKIPNDVDLASSREALFWRIENFNNIQTQQQRKILALFEASSGAIYIV